MMKVGTDFAPRKRRKKVTNALDNERNIFLPVSRDNLTVIAYLLMFSI